MNTYKKITLVSCMLAVTGLMTGCGSDEPGAVDTTFSGTVQQGTIQNAYVYLDLDGNGKRDTGEPSTLDNPAGSQFTDAQGHYTLKIPAAVSSKITAKTKVVVGFTANSVDTVTHAVPTGILVSTPPAGLGTTAGITTTTNLTPITTLVAYAPDPVALKAKLKTLGMPDSNALLAPTTNDTTASATPAIIALSKSVEVVISASQSAVSTNENSGIALAQAVATKVASDVTTTTTSLTNSANIATVLSNAATAAIIAQPASVLTTTTDTATATANISQSLDTAISTISGQVGTGDLSTTTAASESTFFTSENATAITTAVNNAVNTVNDNTTPPADTTAPFVSGSTTSVTTSDLKPILYIQFSENVQNVNSTTVTLKTGTTTVAGTVTYDDVSHYVTFTPSSNLTPGSTYTLTLSGGSNGITDIAGNPLVTTTRTLIEAALVSGSNGGTAAGTGISF